MSRIKELYYDYTQNPEYAVQIPQEFEKSYKDFEKKLKEKVGEKFEDHSDLCDLYNTQAAESECFGFVLGFKYAMSLMKECNI